MSTTLASEPDEQFSRIRLSRPRGLRKTNHQLMSHGPDSLAPAPQTTGSATAGGPLH